MSLTCVPPDIRQALKQIVGEAHAATIDGTRIFENSRFARLHGGVTATTRRRRIFLRGSAAQFFADPELILHEYCHVVLQWEPGALTVTGYLRECLLRGYWNNRYEVQARAFAQEHLPRFRAFLDQRSMHRGATPE